MRATAGAGNAAGPRGSGACVAQRCAVGTTTLPRQAADSSTSRYNKLLDVSKRLCRNASKTAKDTATVTAILEKVIGTLQGNIFGQGIPDEMVQARNGRRRLAWILCWRSPSLPL